MHMDRPTTVMVGRMVVWMRVSQRSANGGALDGQRQHDSDGLSGHGHIVGELGHLVKNIRTASPFRWPRSQLNRTRHRS
jgi:hypothetical protein